MEDDFSTIEGRGEAELKVKGSRFLAIALAVSTPEEALVAVRDIARRHHDASHVCYGYRLAAESGSRVSDGGEPSGTAGRPILAAIDHAGLAGVLVTVTRWFGGVKLGTGGLARAYGKAAALALSNARQVTRVRTEVLTVVFPHARTGDVMNVVSRAGAMIIETTYDEDVHLVLDVPRSRLDALAEELVERTAGNLQVFRRGARGPG